MYGRILVRGEEPTIGPVYYTKYMDHGTSLLKGGTKLIYLKSNLEEKQVRGMRCYYLEMGSAATKQLLVNKREELTSRGIHLPFILKK